MLAAHTERIWADNDPVTGLEYLTSMWELVSVAFAELAGTVRVPAA